MRGKPRIGGGFYKAILAIAFILPWTASGQTRQMEVLDVQEVDLGDRSIIYKRVVPPVLLPQAPEPPAPAPSAPAPETAEVETAKPSYTAFVQATVFDGAVSEMRWLDDAGEHVILSNLNAHHIPVMGYETATASYFLIPVAGSQTKNQHPAWTTYVSQGQFEQRWRATHGQSTLPKGAAFVIVSSPGGKPNAATLAAITDLHHYYDAHQPTLIQEHEQREAARLRAEELQKNPPPPKDTIIEYFPIRSVYAGETGASQ